MRDDVRMRHERLRLAGEALAHLNFTHRPS